MCLWLKNWIKNTSIDIDIFKKFFATDFIDYVTSLQFADTGRGLPGFADSPILINFIIMVKFNTSVLYIAHNHITRDLAKFVDS